MARDKIFWSIVLLIALAPLVLAYDCSKVDTLIREQCMEINSASLNESDKTLIISNLMYSNSFFPNHASIYNYNTNIALIDAPIGVSKRSSTYIKDAWLSLMTVMPSVSYNGSLFVDSTAKVLSFYNYRLEIPSNYYSPRYPNTNNNDCQRIYSVSQNTAENRVFFNSGYQGSGKLVSASIISDSSIKSEFSISATVKIDHYGWYRYCCSHNRRGCVSYCYQCSFKRSENSADALTLSDSANVKLYKSNLSADAKSLYSSGGSTKIRLNYSNAFKISFLDSYFNAYDYTYSINSSKQPYNIYTITATPSHVESFQNLIKDNNSIIVKNTEKCNIYAYDFFKIINKSCTFTYNPINLSITTDKITYNPGEEIKINISPQNITLTLLYNNKTLTGRAYSTFAANTSSNRIIASYNGQQADAVIYVQEEGKYNFIYSFIGFCLVIYIMFMFLSKLLG